MEIQIITIFSLSISMYYDEHILQGVCEATFTVCMVLSPLLPIY